METIFSSSIKQELKKRGVAALYLFGSRARGSATHESDYDIGVLLENPAAFQEREARKDLYNAMYDLLADVTQERTNVDIVFLDFASAELSLHVVRHGNTLVVHNPERVSGFREKVLREYADFEPYRLQFQAATLARIG